MFLLLFAETPLEPALLLLRFRACGRGQVAPRWRGKVGFAASAESDGLSLAVGRLHWATAAVALLVLRVVLSVFRNCAWVSAVAILSAVYVVLLGVGCVDAVQGAIFAAGVGAVCPWAGRVRSVGLARGDGVVGLVVAVLRVDAIAVAIVAVAAIVVAAATGAVAHALLSIVVAVLAAVAVVAVSALRVAVGLVAWKVYVSDCRMRPMGRETTNHMRCCACFGVVEIDRMILRINVSLTCTMSIHDKCKDTPPRIIELLLL